MDAILFEMKKAHLAGARFGRFLLKPFGGKLTPARFNLMLALKGKPMRQCDLWKLLGVVRSVVSEMLDSLRKLKWVKSIRAADGRTRLISLTRFGKWQFDLAFKHCILSGDMPLAVDRALEGPLAREKWYTNRYEGSRIAVKLTDHFGWRLEEEIDLYIWDLTKLSDCLHWPDGDGVHFELLIADEGTVVDAKPFEPGDMLAEIED